MPKISLVDAILFDLDGTIIDNLDNIFQSYQVAISQTGLDTLSDTILRSHMGKSIEEISQILGLNSEDKIKFRNYYIDHLSATKHKFVEGMPELLRQIKNLDISMGIVTSKLKTTTDDVLKSLNISKFFEVVITADDVTRLKPHPDPILKALQVLNIKPSRNSYYFGDTENDMISAYSAGITAVGVTWGITGKNLCDLGYVHCLGQPTDLLELIT